MGLFKKKNILFVNGGVKSFGIRFREACVTENLDCTQIRAHSNSMIIAETSGVRYFHMDEELDLKSFGYCFIRVRGRFSHMTSLLSYLLQSYKVPFNDLNNLEHTMVDEKITQMVKFAANGIPIPKSVIFSKRSYKNNIKNITENISFPCVLKTNGSRGDAVWKIENIEELENKMKEVEHELMIVQEFLENNYDIRVLMFNGEFLGAIKRISNDGFYNNASRGGDVEETKISKDELRLSKKACNVLGLDFGGVDFIRTDKGIIFFEINKGPMVYGLESATNLDIPHKLVKEVKKRLK